MASKKNNPNVQKRIAERKAFVAARPDLSKEVARKRFYVQTRAKELEAAGKTVDRAALRKKFETGTIKRAGFQTQQDIQKAANRRSLADSSNSAPLPGPPSTPRTPSPMTRTKAATTRPDMMAMRRKPIANFKTGAVTPSGNKSNTGSKTTDALANAIDSSVKAIGGLFGRNGGISKLNRAVGKELYGMAESTQATFIAPAWNQSVGRIDKRLKVREATPTEAAITTAVTIGSLAAPGGGTVAGSVARRALGKFAGGRTSRAASAVANEARLMLTKTGGLKPPAPTPVRTAARPTAPGKNFSASVARPKVNATPRPSVKPGEVGGVRISSPKPVKAPVKKAAPKPVKAAPAKKAVPAKKAAPKQKVVDLGEEGYGPGKTWQDEKARLKPKKQQSAKPSIKPKKAPAKKAAPTKKSAAKTKMTQQEKIDYAKSPQMGKDLETMTKGRVKQVPKESAPVKAPATKSVPKTSTGRTSTSPAAGRRVEGVPTFKTQAEYNKFMDTGGKEALRRMSTGQQLSFEQANRAFVIGRSRARQAQVASRVSAAEKRAAVVARRNKMLLERMARKGLTFTE